MSNKYQKEIEEILEQAGESGKHRRGGKTGPSLWRLIWLYVAKSVGGKDWSLKPGRVMVIAILLLLSALILRTSLLAWAGLLLFIVGYGMFFVRPPKIEKRWRGQSLEDSGDSWWDRFRRRLR